MATIRKTPFIDRAASERLLLKKALQRYEAEVVPTKRPSTQRREKPAAANLKAKLGDYSLAAITPDIVAGYRDQRLAEGLSASTVRLELALLSHLYTVAIKEWRTGLTYNPVANIRKPAPHRGRDRRLSKDEEQQLLRACDKHSNPMLGQIVRLALHTGMRAGEIRSLRRSQVNLEKRVVTLTETKNGSARTVPLPYEFRPQWHRTLAAIGIKDLRFHDLRHEAVSRLVEAGLGDQEVAAISGHKSMQMLRRYTHLRAEDLVRRLDQVGVR